MVISRTPLRISFFGGGTDYPAWFLDNGGAVLSTSINKFSYITLRELPPFFDHKYRLAYSKLEFVRELGEIDHPSIRACLQFFGIEHGVGIHYDSDLPARTGLGSSSAFTVGLLEALHALKGEMVGRVKLMEEAIFIEQKMICESVGCQDQAIAVHGGFNLITFGRQGQISLTPITLAPSRLALLNDHLMLFYTGISRIASELASTQIEKIPERKKELTEMQAMVFEAMGIIASNRDIAEFGRLLHEAWMLKRSITDRISTPAIDDLYEVARANGAIGGKLLGAGGGGFFLIFARPEDQDRIREALREILLVPFSFERSGSQIIFFDYES